MLARYRLEPVAVPLGQTCRFCEVAGVDARRDRFDSDFVCGERHAKIFSMLLDARACTSEVQGETAGKRATKIGRGRPPFSRREVASREVEVSDYDALLVGLRAAHRLLPRMKDTDSIERELHRRVLDFKASPPPAGTPAKDRPEVFLLPLGFSEYGSALARFVSWALSEHHRRRELADARSRRPLRDYAAMLTETIRSPNPRFLEARDGEMAPLPYAVTDERPLASIRLAFTGIRAKKRLLSRRRREG